MIPILIISLPPQPAPIFVVYFFQASVLFSKENAPQPPPPLIWPRPKAMKGNCPLEIPEQRAGW